jgi:phospholipid transport system transporter-binding protein
VSAAPPRLAEASPGAFELAGELTLAFVGPLRDQGRSQLAASAGQQLHVDLKGVTRADSSGLALLVDWLAWARAAGRSLRYSNLPAEMLALARLSELDSMLA